MINNLIPFTFCIFLIFHNSYAFKNALSKPKYFRNKTSKISNQISNHRLNLLLAPQVAFAAACAWGVFSYVWNNIDEIKEKQAISINATMTKQASDIKSVQEIQKANIERIQEEQRKNILKAKLEAEQASKKNSK